MDFSTAKEVINRVQSYYVVAQSRLVLEIKNFKTYELGDSITSQTVKFVEIDSTWKINVIPYYDMSGESFFTTAEVTITIENLPDEIWMSHNSMLLITIGKEPAIAVKIEGPINTTTVKLTEIQMQNLSDTFDVCLRITSQRKRSFHNKFYDPFSTARNTLAHVRKMFGDPTFSDFTFVVQGKEFKIHKTILAPASSVMHKLFTTDFEESSTNQCKVHNIQPEIFELMLRFCYGFPFTFDISGFAVELYEAAHYYEIDELKKICKSEIHSSLKPENCLKIYELACRFDIEDLKIDAWIILKREVLNIYKPLSNEPWPFEKVQEGIERKRKEDEFWNN